MSYLLPSWPATNQQCEGKEKKETGKEGEKKKKRRSFRRLNDPAGGINLNPYAALKNQGGGKKEQSVDSIDNLSLNHDRESRRGGEGKKRKKGKRGKATE